MSPAIARVLVVVACAVLMPLGLGRTAGAQSPRPSPTPAPTPVAFTAHAHATISVVTSGGTFNGSLQLGLAQRTNLTRVDVLSVKSDTLPIPPIGVTAVIDRAKNTLTVWNDTTKKYRVQSFLPQALARPTPRPSASPRPTSAPVRRTSPFANLEVLELTMKLTGHTTTLALPTTGFSYDLQVQRKADKAPLHVAATMQLADEFFVFPMTFDVSITPGSSPSSSKFSYAVDDLTRETPPLARFTIPAGYTEARSLPEVIFQRRSGPWSPMPASSPTPVASPTPR